MHNFDLFLWLEYEKYPNGMSSKVNLLFVIAYRFGHHSSRLRFPVVDW